MSSLPALRRVAALLVLACGGAYGADLPPLQDFFKTAELSDAKLSPDARFLALRLTGPDGREKLGVYDVATRQTNIAASFGKLDVRTFRWVNSERLVLDVYDKFDAELSGSPNPGLFAVNRDGGDFKQLVGRTGREFQGARPGKTLSKYTGLLNYPGAQNSTALYVYNVDFTNDFTINLLNLYRLDTVTGLSEPVKRPAAPVMGWILDQHGEPRMVSATEDGQRVMFYLDPANQQWRKLANFPKYGADSAQFYPLGFGPDGTLYVSSNNGGDTSEVYAYDIAAGKLGKSALVGIDSYDFRGKLVGNDKQLLGLRYTSDAVATQWLAPAMQALQAAVDAQRPATINLITPALRAATPYVLVQSYSDVQPDTYALFNTDSQTFTDIGASRPRIAATAMAHQEMVHYKARDGLDIPAWLTLPKGPAKALPMVLLVHPGPDEAGDSWRWDAETQFLASRGYAVLEPIYRGSSGRGARFAMAGYQQWGLKMQDDLADGARWAIAQGYADASRICISGVGYGGYATLMGLINDQDLYRCGIARDAITDLTLYAASRFGKSSNSMLEWRANGFPLEIGDPRQDAARFKATSPLQQAARLTRPLLIAYTSESDMLQEQGGALRSALGAGAVEWLDYQQNSYNPPLESGLIDFWSRVEKFLDRHIGHSNPQSNPAQP